MNRYDLNREMRLAGGVVLSALLAGCAATYSVRPLAPKEKLPTEGSVVYFLPRTVLVFKIPVTHQAYRPTELTKYAATAFAGVPPVELPPGLNGKEDPKDPWQESWRIGDAVLATSAEADSDARFLVKVSGGLFEQRSLALTLNEIGVLTDGASKVEDRRLATLVTSFEALGKITGAGLKFPRAAPVDPEPSDEHEREARRLRQILSELHEQRLQLLGGGADGVPVESLREMLAGLSAIEETTRQRFYSFTSTTYEIVVEARPSFTDSGSNISEISLFELGIADDGNAKTQDSRIRVNRQATSLYVSALPASVEAGDGFVPQQKVSLAITRDENDPVLSTSGSPSANSGFFYRIPGIARIILLRADDKDNRVTTLLETAARVAQAGVVCSLPRGTRSLNSEFAVTLHPESGALKTVGVTSHAFDQQLITRVGDAAAGIITAAGETKAAEAAAKTDFLDRATEKLTKLKAFLDAARSIGVAVPDPTAVAGSTGGVQP